MHLILSFLVGRSAVFDHETLKPPEGWRDFEAGLPAGSPASRTCSDAWYGRVEATGGLDTNGAAGGWPALLWHDEGMDFAATVTVNLRPGIADPQGATIERSLPALGYDGVRGVAVGKVITFTVSSPDEQSARNEVTEMCDKFLTNPVIEDATIKVTPA